MSKDPKISGEMRGAFVDGELDDADWARIAEVVERDPGLREEMCSLFMLKEMVHRAYAMPPAPPARVRRAAACRPWRSAAAALFAAVAGIAGWFAHTHWEGEAARDPVSAYVLRGDWKAVRSDWRSLEANQVLVHVSSNANLTGALDEIERFLRAARSAQRRVEVEIVANSTGIELLDANLPAYAARVAALRRQFPELRLVACAQTLARQHAEGKQVVLLPGTVVAVSALDEVAMRLQAGWVYVHA